MKRKNGLLMAALIFGAVSFGGCADDSMSKAVEVESQAEEESRHIVLETGMENASEPAAEVKENVLETERSEAAEAADEILTLEEKIGQLFLVRPDALISEEADLDGVTELTAGMKDMLRQYPVGGICQFGQNIVSPEQLKKFHADLQEASTIPLFLTVDEEGGAVARLANHKEFNLPKYESAAAVGKTQDAECAEAMGHTIGSYLSEYGFNMDFAPVADVNTNPDNPIIGTRAFSSDAVTASKMAAAAAKGLREEGIIPTLKHFPGHGDTNEDSHTSLAVTNKSLEELKTCEFLPFASDSGMHAVMVGHIAVPQVTGNDLPATLSSEIIQMIPNRENSLIITDSLEMQAISERYDSGEAAVLALEAGCDVLLMPLNLPEAYHAVLEAVKSGRIREERIDVSVDKIISFKKQFAILQ